MLQQLRKMRDIGVVNRTDKTRNDTIAFATLMRWMFIRFAAGNMIQAVAHAVKQDIAA
jgi:hypothetical protein